jgi:hypothetical protein
MVSLLLRSSLAKAPQSVRLEMNQVESQIFSSYSIRFNLPVVLGQTCSERRSFAAVSGV